MRYLVSVCTVTQKTGDVKAIAVAWHSGINAYEETQRLTSKIVSQYAIAKAVTSHTKERTAANAALSRLVEKLFLRGLILNPANGDPPLHIVTLPKHKNTRLLYPHEALKTHVALKGAARLLKGHLNG